MACCNSYTECNELITIEYLKNFIGTLIQDSNGTPITISTTFADTYCPTYDEIKILLPVHSKGANGPLDDVDGIVLNGSGNSTVKQQELSVEYTRWKSFTISANPTTIDQCGGSTSFSYVNTFTRYDKSMDSNCDISTDSEDKNDTQNSRVTFTTSEFGTITNHSMTVGENPHGTSGTALARSTVITGHVTFRGSEKTNTVTITQQELGGEYRYWYVDHGDQYDYDITCTNSVPYTGGRANAIGSYKVDYWDVYKWWDDCNHDFSGRTENRNSRTSSFTELAGSYVFEGLPCEGKGSSYTFTYHGKHCDTTQNDNPNSCQDCPPKNYTSYTDVTVDCSVGSATVYGVWYHFSGGELDDQGKCVGYTTESGNTSYTKSWSCDTRGGWIDDHIYVSGAPCCSEYCEYTFDDVVLPCDAAPATSKNVNYTEICHHADGTTSSIIGNSSVSILAVECNSGSAKTVQSRVVGRSLATSKPKIIQNGNCTCCECEIDATAGSSISMTGVTNSVIGTYTATSCVTNIGVISDKGWVTNLSASNGQVRANVAANPDMADRTANITVSGKSGSDTCSSGFTITQAKKECINPSVSYKIADIEIECTSAASKTLTTGYTATTTYSNCGPKTESGTTNVTVPAVSCNSGSVITIQSGNTGATLAEASPKITQKGGCTCCRCSDLTVGSTSENWAYNVTTSKDITITSASCIGNSITINSPTHFNATLGNGKVTVSPKGNNTSTSAYVDTLTVSYTAGSYSCSSSITLTQDVNPNPTCPTSVTYTYDQTVHITCDNQNKVTIPYTSHTVNEDCTVTDKAGEKVVRYDFPANCNGDVYNLNVDGYTVTVTQDPCDCSCSPGTDNFDVLPVHIENYAGAVSADSWRCGMQPGYIESYSVSYDPDDVGNWLNMSMNSTGLSFVALASNPYTHARSAVIYFTTSDAYINSGNCGKPFCKTWFMMVTQSAMNDPCPCSQFEPSQTVTHIGSEACNSKIIGTYDPNTCIQNLQVFERGGKTWVTPSIGGGQITITCQANTTGESRTCWIMIYGITGNGSTCDRTWEVTQDG